jgi:hypothetical protein
MNWGAGKPFNSREKIVETGKPGWLTYELMNPISGKVNRQPRIHLLHNNCQTSLPLW